MNWQLPPELEKCLEVKTARECYPPNQTDQMPKTGFDTAEIIFIAVLLILIGIAFYLPVHFRKHSDHL